MTYDEETNYCCTCCHQRAARFSGACHAGKRYTHSASIRGVCRADGEL
jgi:hypothetical protein